MTDLQKRFRSLDSLQAPNLWPEVEARAQAEQPTHRRSPWTLVVVMLLLTLLVGGAVLVGSGIVKLPIAVDASASPSSAQESIAASSSPVVVVPPSWTATGNMIEGLAPNTATLLLDGRVLVTGSGPLVSAELYDATSGSWTTTGMLAEPRSDDSATLLPDGSVLVAGGYIVSGGPDPSTGVGGAEVFGVASAELYDPGTGTWTATGSMSDARCAHTATLLGNGKVLAAGGTNCGGFDPLATAELYDPATRSWSAAERMVGLHQGHTATLLLDGRVLVVGGGTDSAELYDPATGHWTATGAPLGVLVGHTATLLRDGKVLVTGGMSGTGASDLAELYDPATGQWAASGSMGEGRIYHSATLLPNGKVLVAGGTNSVIDGGQASSTAELYDPATRQWTPTAGMIEAGGRTATLLRDGTVLVVGVVIDGATSQLYEPGSGS